MKFLDVGPVLEALHRIFPPKGHEAKVPFLPLKQYHVLFLPLLSSVSSISTKRLIEVASHFPQVHKVVLCYLISVPRALTIEGALPEEEEAAGEILAEVARDLSQRGFEVQTQVRRARLPVEEALKVIREIEADVVLLADDTLDSLDAAEGCFPFARPLSEKAPCEVILLHAV